VDGLDRLDHHRRLAPGSPCPVNGGVTSARQRHRHLLDLLGTSPAIGPLAQVPPDVHLLGHPELAAYSVPGLRPRFVVSAGAASAFDAAELNAVIDHERAHLRQHHDLVVQPFIAWRRSFPFLPAAAVALQTVEMLTEDLATMSLNDGRDA
jgi:hypothetical protein